MAENIVFDEDKLEKLIKLVEEKECIYAKTLSSHRDKKVRDDAWREVAGEIYNMDGKHKSSSLRYSCQSGVLHSMKSQIN